MGLFGSSAPPPPQVRTAADGGFIAPDRSERALCWEARDRFFVCLDSAGIVDSVKDDKASRQSCGQELVAFEQACKESWVTYFKKRRVMEHQRDATIKKLSAEGAQGMDVSTATGSGSAALRGR